MLRYCNPRNVPNHQSAVAVAKQSKDFLFAEFAETRFSFFSLLYRPFITPFPSLKSAASSSIAPESQHPPAKNPWAWTSDQSR